MLISITSIVDEKLSSITKIVSLYKKKKAELAFFGIHITHCIQHEVRFDIIIEREICQSFEKIMMIIVVKLVELLLNEELSKVGQNKNEKQRAFDALNSLVINNEGMFTSAEAQKYNIPRRYIKSFIEEYSLDEDYPGFYSTKDTFSDEMFALQYVYSKGIYSHETALMLWELTDLIPFDYTMTFPAGYNNPNILKWGIKPKYTMKEKFEIGKTTAKTIFGNEIVVYDKERTLCDIFQTRHNTLKEVQIEAIKSYVSLKDKDTNKLMKYAKEFRVEKIIRTYLEVLL